VLGQCAALAHLDLGDNGMGEPGAESIVGVIAQCPALAHLNLRNNFFLLPCQRIFQESWCSAQRCLTSISATIRSDQQGQTFLQECCRSAQRWLTSISSEMTSRMQGQRVLQECWRSAQRWLTSISAPMTSALSGEGGFELRGVVKPLAFVCRHLALLALCHLFSRQAT